MKYRDLLYSNYSAHFGGGKEYDSETQAAAYRPVYERFLPDDTDLAIADVGCGKGEWLRWLYDSGFRNLCGIDVAASELEALDNLDEIDRIEGLGTEALRQHPDRFDLIHAKDLIEHLTRNEIVEFLAACHDALRPGGEVWVTTFNGQSPIAPTIHYGDFTHETALTPTSMAQVLQASGFDDVRVHGIFEPPATWTGRLRRIVFPFFESLDRFRRRIYNSRLQPIPGVESESGKPGIFGRARRAE